MVREPSTSQRPSVGAFARAGCTTLLRPTTGPRVRRLRPGRTNCAWATSRTAIKPFRPAGVAEALSRPGAITSRALTAVTSPAIAVGTKRRGKRVFSSGASEAVCHRSSGGTFRESDVAGRDGRETRLRPAGVLRCLAGESTYTAATRCLDPNATYSEAQGLARVWVTWFVRPARACRSVGGSGGT